MLSSPLAKAFAFRLKGTAASEFADTVQAYMLTQLEHSFKTLSFYRSLDMMMPDPSDPAPVQVDENGEVLSPDQISQNGKDQP